jgi:hypothetical protein
MEITALIAIVVAGTWLILLSQQPRHKEYDMRLALAGVLVIVLGLSAKRVIAITEDFRSLDQQTQIRDLDEQETAKPRHIELRLAPKSPQR